MGISFGAVLSILTDSLGMSKVSARWMRRMLSDDQKRTHLYISTVSHFSYAPFFQGPHFLTKMLESNILYDNLFIDILSV